MALTKEFFKRDTNIKAKVLADSVNSQTRQRIITFEIEYPRFILAEMNTHKMLEKNSSSSRAIPIKAMIEQIKNNPAVPIYWGGKQSGMQAGDEIDNDVLVDDYCYPIKLSSRHTWLWAANEAINFAKAYDEAGYHKQVPNRLLEPFQMMKTVITGTDWDNFFNLRIHPTTQPEFCMLAYKMYKAMQESQPLPLYEGEWHLPYINRKRDNQTGAIEYTTQEYKVVDPYTAIKVSSSCCAQTSYRKSDDSVEKADKVFDMLINADVIHASPFGHLAKPIVKSSRGVLVSGIDACNTTINDGNPLTWEDGVTHMRKDGTLCSGNLAGFISYRHLIPNNTCYNFDFEERMKLFE